MEQVQQQHAQKQWVKPLRCLKTYGCDLWRSGASLRFVKGPCYCKAASGV